MRTLCRYKGVEIIEGHLMSDHVHMLVMIPPKLSVSSFMGYLKGKSALMIFDRHANLKYKYGNRHFWVEGHLMSDHVHMLVMIPPKLSVSSFMGYLKGKSALMIFDRHANLKYKYGNRHFWVEGYYVSTVGLND